MMVLQTAIPELRLVPPDPKRDAPFAVEWFTGEAGHETLRLMGNTEDQITPTNLEKERQILRSFIALEVAGKQLTWMMRLNDRTIGAIWVELVTSPNLPAPAISIMIGDYHARRQGVGTAAVQAVIDDMKRRGVHVLHARYLVSNRASRQLFRKQGFQSSAEPYVEHGLRFQNVCLDL